MPAFLLAGSIGAKGAKLSLNHCNKKRSKADLAVAWIRAEHMKAIS